MRAQGWWSWMLVFTLLVGWVGVNQYQIKRQLSYLKTENELMELADDAKDVIADEGLAASEEEVEKVLYTLENKEARTMVERLVTQNEKLRQEKLALRKQINRLSASLAVAKVENDDYKLRFKQENMGKSLPVATAKDRSFQAVLVDVNSDLDMVVLDLGSLQGIKPGMLFSIVRDELVIGKVKVFDVRDRFSGALVIEKNKEGLQSGDRAIPWTERYGS